MDLRAFYRKMREIESGITEPFAVVVSLETPDGGRAGIKTEVERSIASKIVAEGRARLATAEEAIAYRSEIVEAHNAAEQIAQASRVQFTVLSESDVKALKGALKPTRQ